MKMTMTLTFDSNDALDSFGDPLYPSEIDDPIAMNAFLSNSEEIATALPVVYDKLLELFPGCKYILRNGGDMQPDTVEIMALFHGTSDDAAEKLGQMDRFSLEMGDELAWKIFFEVQLV